MTKCSGTGGSQATSPASPQSTAFLLLIILVILNEISVKTQAFFHRRDRGDKISADSQNHNGVAQFPVTKGCNTSRAQRQLSSPPSED